MSASGARPVQGLIIIDRSGSLRYTRDLSGDPPDASLVSGFFSSATSFVSSMAGEKLSSIVLDDTRFTVVTRSGTLLIARGPSSAVESTVVNLLEDVASLVEFLFGPPASWDETLGEMVGFDDLIDGMITSRGQGKADSAPHLRDVVGGVDRVLLDTSTRDQLDRALAALEDTGESVRSSALFLGDMVLHSRLPPRETLLTRHLLRTRPLGVATTRSMPVHVKGSWSLLHIARLRSLAVALLCPLETGPSSLRPVVQSLGRSIGDAGIRLPNEPPPLLLRHFAPREAVAFAYTRGGIAVVPELRAGGEESGIVSIFSWLHARARLVMSGGGTPSVLVRHEGLWFHAQETPGGGELYVLYAGHLAVEVIEATSLELLYTLERFAG